MPIRLQGWPWVKCGIYAFRLDYCYPRSTTGLNVKALSGLSVLEPRGTSNLHAGRIGFSWLANHFPMDLLMGALGVILLMGALGVILLMVVFQ
jgi:hypothetical protein